MVLIVFIYNTTSYICTNMETKIEKLSAEPASEPISHNPEGDVKQNFKSFGQNRVMNTRDRVMNKIANLK